MLEVRGREIRTTEVDDKSKTYQPPFAENRKGGIMLRSGQQLFIGCDNTFLKSTSERLYCNYRDLPKIVKPNDVVYLDDGRIVCLVTDCEHVRCFSSNAYRTVFK